MIHIAEQVFMKVDEVAAELGVSNSYAYKLIRELNKELKAAGCIVINREIWADVETLSERASACATANQLWPENSSYTSLKSMKTVKYTQSCSPVR